MSATGRPRFTQYIADGLTAAGIEFDRVADDCLQISDTITVSTGSRKVWIMRVLVESPTQRKTDHKSYPFKGRKWRKRMIAFVLAKLAGEEAKAAAVAAYAEAEAAMLAAYARAFAEVGRPGMSLAEVEAEVERRRLAASSAAEGDQ